MCVFVQTKLTPKASKAVSKDYAEMVNSALRELWDKYCVAGKPSMNGLVEGLKAAGGICWAQENIKDIEKQARILQAALDAIYDSSALKHGLQLIHTVVSKALGLGEGECIRYSSVPSVLGLLLLQEGDEKDEEEENGGIKVFVKDVVRGKLKEDETEELKALKKTVEGAFGCDVSLLVARYQQVQHALMSAIDGVKRMTSEETKKTLHEAMTEVNNALESVRRYLVKTTNSPFDFGGITNKLVAICGKYGESKLDKSNTAEAIVIHTFSIIEVLTQQ